MKNPIVFCILVLALIQTGCSLNPNGPPPIDYPFYITSEVQLVKNIEVPVGTKVIYQKRFLKKGKQNKLQAESDIHTIEFPKETPILWGGVPVLSIEKFYNQQMIGYSIEADFSKLAKPSETPFSALWKSCDNDLGIDVKNPSDWSFNKENIKDVRSSGVLYQRYFKDDKHMQDILDKLYHELMKVDSSASVTSNSFGQTHQTVTEDYELFTS